MRFYVWKPDRELNPQYEGIPDLDPAGVIIDHPRLDNGEPCSGAVNFYSEAHKEISFGNKRITWTVESLDPLTISPSVLCRGCGDHGFIRDGRWVPV
jgi:hypothetical protein